MVLRPPGRWPGRVLGLATVTALAAVVLLLVVGPLWRELSEVAVDGVVGDRPRLR